MIDVNRVNAVLGSTADKGRAEVLAWAQLAADVAVVIINRQATETDRKYALQETLEETVRILEAKI